MRDDFPDYAGWSTIRLAQELDRKRELPDLFKDHIEAIDNVLIERENTDRRMLRETRDAVRHIQQHSFKHIN